jgi:methylenetetrahydrofolate dehydrogenase (NADP+)/methenyltetrahydrofolate cyclohydrolase/formyltetrahydrofolate synthetase
MTIAATVIDGKSMAQAIRTELAEEITTLRQQYKDFTPHLAVVQVGDREDSSLYIRQKERAAEEVINNDRSYPAIIIDCIINMIVIHRLV